MIDVALTTEFTIPAGEAPWPWQTWLSGGLPPAWSVWRSRPTSALAL